MAFLQRARDGARSQSSKEAFVEGFPVTAGGRLAPPSGVGNGAGTGRGGQMLGQGRKPRPKDHGRLEHVLALADIAVGHG